MCWLHITSPIATVALQRDILRFCDGWFKIIARVTYRYASSSSNNGSGSDVYNVLTAHYFTVFHTLKANQSEMYSIIFLFLL